MVADQVARLKSGAVRPDRFDFAALKFDGGRWGRRALAELSVATDLPDAAIVNADAQRALSIVSRPAVHAPLPHGDDIAGRIKVYPDDARCRPISTTGPPGHWRSRTCNCFACDRTSAVRRRFVPLAGADAEAILFLDDYASSVFEQDKTGQWRKTAGLTARRGGAIPFGAPSRAARFNWNPTAGRISRSATNASPSSRRPCISAAARRNSPEADRTCYRIDSESPRPMIADRDSYR